MIEQHAYTLTANVRQAVNVDSSGDGIRLLIHNNDDQHPLYIGNGSVTAANGLHVPKGTTIEVKIESDERLYLVSGHDIEARVLALDVRPA